MTQEEKVFCERCSIHNNCGFVTRELEHKCELIDVFQMGEEAMLNKAVKWLQEVSDNHYIMDYEDSHEVTEKELIEYFNKAMENDF